MHQAKPVTDAEAPEAVRRPGRTASTAVVAALVACAAFGHGVLAAQTQVEFRVGRIDGGLPEPDHPLGVLVTALADEGETLELTLKRSLTPSLAVVGGVMKTVVSEDFVDAYRVQATHAVLGVQSAAGVPWAWVRTGLLLGSASTKADGESSAFSVGLLASLGFDVGIGRFRFLPGLSYRWLQVGTPAAAIDSYSPTSAELGFGFQFGGGRTTPGNASPGS